MIGPGPGHNPADQTDNAAKQLFVEDTLDRLRVLMGPDAPTQFTPHVVDRVLDSWPSLRDRRQQLVAAQTTKDEALRDLARRTKRNRDILIATSLLSATFAAILTLIFTVEFSIELPHCTDCFSCRTSDCVDHGDA